MSSQCKGKRAWKRMPQAYRALQSILRKEALYPTRTSVPVRVYRCPECRQYHLTSNPRRKRG